MALCEVISTNPAGTELRIVYAFSELQFANLVGEKNMGLAKIEEENDFACSIERLLIDCG